MTYEETTNLQPDQSEQRRRRDQKQDDKDNEKILK